MCVQTQLSKDDHVHGYVLYARKHTYALFDSLTLMACLMGYPFAHSRSGCKLRLVACSHACSTDYASISGAIKLNAGKQGITFNSIYSIKGNILVIHVHIMQSILRMDDEHSTFTTAGQKVLSSMHAKQKRTMEAKYG